MPFQSGLEHIVREAELLAPYTWLRLGGAAEYFAEPTAVDELRELARRCQQEGRSVRLLGGGSNVLVRDEGVAGLVVHLSAATFCELTVRNGIVVAGGGAKLAHLIATAVREGLAGLETLVGLPGTVGGALHKNASSHVGDIGQWTRLATVMDHAGGITTRPREDLFFGYRESNLDELAILEAEFILEPSDPQELTKRMQKLWIINKAAQPLRSQNTAMLFKDTGGVNPGTLIEQAGLKNARVGGAELSDRNANFVVTRPGATSRDVLQLIEQLRGKVAERLGVELETAIEIW
jgi:UDP-N-acetylmuramate dehydrogenase